MKLTLLISSLRCGGTERTASLLANSWVESGNEVEILTMSGKEVAPFFSLDARIRHTPLGIQNPSQTKLHGLINNVRRVLVIRAALKRSRPAVLVAFMEGTTALAILAAQGLHMPVIISEVAVPALQSGGLFWSVLRKLLYPRAAMLIVPSKGVQAFFNQKLRLACQVIPNPVAAPSQGGDVRTDGARLIAVGRLSSEKGFDTLLHAFTHIAKSQPNATLTIFGEGPLLNDLLTLRDSLGLRQKVDFPGTTRDLAQELKKADIFVLSSRYEGFGNVLCEAMAVGLAVVSFDCPTGPREIIRHGVDGLLVPAGNIEKLADAVSALLSDRKQRMELSRRAPEVLERFGLPRISKEWLAAFERVQQDSPVAVRGGSQNNMAIW